MEHSFVANVAPLDVPRETRAKLDGLAQFVAAEATRQNLVSLGSLADLQARHIDDSLQLAPLISSGPLVDIGSGAGFPGLVLACVSHAEVHLVEPRRLRAEFLAKASGELGLSNVRVHCRKIEHVHDLGPISTITARAVMSLGRLFEAALPLASSDTRWVLPKGRSAESELAEARRTWQGRFELVVSRTDPTARIVIAEDVRRRRGR